MVASNTNLMQASRQWAIRPADQRFWTLAEVLEHTRLIKSTSFERKSRMDALQFVSEGEEVALQGQNTKAALGHYSFGQISRLLGAPADYLRTLPTETTASLLNYGLSQYEDKSKQVALLLRQNGGLHLRAAVSEKYTRIWNCDIISRLSDVLPEGWRPAPARPSGSGDPRARIATEADCLQNRMPGLGIKPGDTIAPAGLYASEKDCFLFLVNESNPIEVDGQTLGRGFFLWNSEVGDQSFGLMTFLYNSVCGNHIVWGASDIQEVNIRHIGNADNKAWGSLRVELKKYGEESTSQYTDGIRKAKALILGADKDEVISAIFKQRFSNLSRGEIAGSYQAALDNPQDHGNSNPNSVWGMVQGMTRHAQETRYADSRVRLDRAAGKVLEMAF